MHESSRYCWYWLAWGYISVMNRNIDTRVILSTAYGSAFGEGAENKNNGGSSYSQQKTLLCMSFELPNKILFMRLFYLCFIICYVSLFWSCSCIGRTRAEEVLLSAQRTLQKIRRYAFQQWFFFAFFDYINFYSLHLKRGASNKRFCSVEDVKKSKIWLSHSPFFQLPYEKLRLLCLPFETDDLKPSLMALL